MAAALLTSAWFLAHQPPVHRADNLDELESVNIGFNLLIAGAVPWLLQLAGIAILVVMACRRWMKASAAPLVVGILLPLLVGSTWWIGRSAAHWGSDPLEAVLRDTTRLMERELGETLVTDALLYEIVGPLVCPLKLAAPLDLQGWNFLWAALSTVVLLVYWTGMGRWIQVDFSRSLPTRRQVAQVCAAVLLYTTPAWIRLVRTAAEVFGSVSV